MNHSFWAGGQDACSKALRDVYEPQLNELYSAMKTAEELDEQVSLRLRFEALNAEYREKLKAAEPSVY